MNHQKSSQSPFFNKDRLYKYVKDFSFPRLCGTEGEKKAVELTIKSFEEIGFKNQEIETEDFEFSDFYSTTLIKLIMTLGLTSTLMILLFSYIYFIFAFITVGAMTIVVLLIIKGLKHPEDSGFWGEYFGTILPATNVFVKIPSKSLLTEEAGNIIISAHLDSKSQTFKTAWRIVTYRVWLFSGILLGGFYMAILFSALTGIIFHVTVFQISIWILTVLISFSNILLMFLNTHNKSPGALDNASGMSIVFELSSYYRDRPLDNFNLWFCQFSAEELGTMGSRVFVNNHEDQFVKGRVFQLNLDMVSAAGMGKKNRIEYLKSYGVLPRRKIAPLLSEYLENAAKEENIVVDGFHLTTGAHLDSVAFHLRGYDAVDISTRWGARWTHNEVDTPDKVDPKVLFDACILLQNVISNIDKDYKSLCSNEKLVCDGK